MLDSPYMDEMSQWIFCREINSGKLEKSPELHHFCVSQFIVEQPQIDFQEEKHLRTHMTPLQKSILKIYKMLLEMRKSGLKIELEALLFQEGYVIDYIAAEITDYFDSQSEWNHDNLK